MGGEKNPRWERKPEERPAVLLEAALSAFAEGGYAGTTLEQVAEAAGVSKATIYYYFQNKDDLLRQAVSCRVRSSFGEVKEALEAMDTPASVKLRFALRKAWQVWVDPGWGKVSRLLLGWGFGEHRPLFELWAREGPLKGWAALERLIEEGQRTGEFRRDVDAKVAGRLIASGLSMQALMHVHLNMAAMDPCDTDRILDSALDVFFAGLRALPGSAPAAAGAEKS